MFGITSEGDGVMQCVICYSEIWNNTCPVCEQRKNYHKEKRATRRYNRQRIIKKRTKIIYYSWRLPDNSRLYSEPGRMDKHNLSCNCWMCKGEKKAGIMKPKYRFLENINQG